MQVPEQVVVSQLNGDCKVGLAWAGSPTHVNDRSRSMTLADLLPVTEDIEAQFYALQMPLSAEERDLLKQHGITDLEPELPGYARTAALIDQLDLVIAVDTAVAHLAAAMGKPTWILLCQNADWRWHLEGESSEWYPTAQLFRQGDEAGWSPVVKRVHQALSQFKP